ncbi:T9SS type A sorting domain-containing protein [Flavobacterium sp.]|uniref:T9SS type A sorting domain-containing protein n=1 Tax=Flavobacterium sp. TaxID=239 RepID=UPI003262F2C8
MKKALLTKIFLFLAIGGMYAQVGDIDLNFNATIGVGANLNVTSLAVQTDGKIIIVGEFTNYAYTPKNRIARLNPDGTLDYSFDIGTGANDRISAVTVLPNGKIMIIGNFTSYNGIAINRIARLNTDGTLDTTFIAGTGFNGYSCLAIQTDGKILIGGYFTSYNDVATKHIVRLNTNGSLDNTFDPGVGPTSTVREIVIKTDGKIVIIGAFLSYAGISRNGIAQLNADGTLDTTFFPGNGAVGIESIALQNDGKVLIGGYFAAYNFTSKNGVVRLNLDGTIDNTFNLGGGPDFSVKEIVIQSDAKILIGGQFTSYDGISRNRIARLNADGSLDVNFDTAIGANETVSSIALQADGKILTAGDFTSYNDTLRGRLARINTDGTIDTTFFNPEGFAKGSDNTIVSVAMQPDGKILLAGEFTSYNGIPKVATIRLNADGTLDAPFNPTTIGTGSAVEYSIVVQPDGKILLAGRHFDSNFILRGRLLRMNAEDGSLDETFYIGAGNANGDVYSIALQSDGKILIGGIFSSYTGVSRNRIARLNTDGKIDTTFDPLLGTNNAINSIVVQPDGKILIGGTFTTYNGISRNRIARLNADGTLDTTFNPGTGANNIVNAIALQTDGKILISGIFTSYNSTAKKYLVRLNSDGLLDTTFNSGTGADGPIKSIKVQLDKKILIGGGGYFTSYDGILRNNIALLNTDGTLDTTFDPGTGANNEIRAILIQPDGKILIAGNFTAYNGKTVGRITRLLSSDITLSTKEFNKETLLIYPNPATTEIYFSQDLTEIAFYTISGLKTNVPCSSTSANISALPQGIYILKGLENNGKIVTQKIIKN